MDGYFMAMKSDGSPITLGKVTEINTITESPTPEPPLVHIADDTGLTVTITLTKKDKKAWAKILNMPKYKVTEWMFPRKKKRGTMKRERRLRKETARAIINLIRNMDCSNIFRDFGVTAESAGEAIRKYAEMLKEMEEAAKDF